jgi:hypothetical protein
MVSHIHGNVPAFSTEPAVSSGVPAASDNVFEEILQKTAQQNRQNLDAGSGGISSASPGRTILMELFGNLPAATGPASAAPVSPAMESDAAEAPFVPTFQTNIEVTNSFTGQSTGLNPMYFVTNETAQYIADKFGTGEVREEAPYCEGDPYSSTANLYYIQTPNGQWLNAGLLAENYVRMPESQWPGMAAQEIRNAIAQAGG